MMDDLTWQEFTYNTTIAVLLCGVIHFAARTAFKRMSPAFYATLSKFDRISLAERYCKQPQAQQRRT
jgi:hypothetical protein